MLVQHHAKSVVETKIVFYKDGGVGEELKAGYALCYDHTEDLTPQGAEFDELIRGSVCVRPATANLEYFAGIVTKILSRTEPHSLTDFSGFVEVAVPRRDTFIKAFCNLNATLGQALVATNNSFALTLDGFAGIADSYSRRTAAVALETLDTSVTPGNALVKLVA